MSREVDERILSMRFDNDQFEKGVKETIKLLDEFEKELKFEGAEEGLKNVAKAADKVDLSNLAESASVIEVKFSMMSIAVITAISNIVTSAQEAGTRLVKALSVDQINAGFGKYTQKTASVQTIMNATGKSVEEVTAALAKLQWFSDETSYSFVDMTSNVGKFTSAGVELNTAISAMQGIANAAADAGSTTVEASRAMYNFSQALAKGYVQLIDWKSIENANMATLTFKQTIIDSAVAMGTLTEAENGYVVTGTNATVTAANFNEELKQGWFTTEVLLDALGKYSQYSDAIYDVSDAFDTCADAIAATSAEGMELGQRAFLAAQQAKTFTEAIDATKDAVSSGWMESFEIIFGNFNESVELWTAFTNTLWDVFASGAESRNDLLRSGLATGWNQLLNDYITDASSLKSIITSTAKEQGVAIDELIKEAGSFEKSLKAGWLTADLLSDSLDNIINEFQTLPDAELKAKGYTEETVKSIVKLKKAMDDGSVSAEELAESIAKQSGRENIIEGISNAYQALLSIVVPVKNAINNIFPPMTAERLYELTERFKNFTAQMGLSEDAAHGLQVIIQDLLVPFRILWEVIKAGTKVAGTFIYLIFNIADALVALRVGGGPIPDLLKRIFGEERYARLAEALSKIVSNISKDFKALRGYAKDFLKGVTNFTGANTILKSILNVAKEFGGTVMDGVIFVLEKIAAFNLSDFASAISSGISSTIEYFKAFFSSVIDFRSMAEKLKEWFSKISDSSKSFGERIKQLGRDLLDFVKSIDPASIAVAAFGILLIAFATKLINLMSIIEATLSGVKTLVTGITSITKVVNKMLFSSTLKELATSVTILAGALVILAAVDSDKLWSSLGAVVILFGMVVGALELLSLTLGKNKQMTDNAFKLTSGVLEIAGAIALLAMSLAVIKNINLAEVADGLIAIGGLLVAMYAFMRAVNTIKTENIAKTAVYVVAFGASLILMVKGIQKLATIDYTGIKNNVGVIVTLLLSLSVIAAIAKGISFSGGAGVIALAGALVLLASVLQKLAGTDMGYLLTGITKFMPILAALFAIMLMIRVGGHDVLGAGIMILALGVSMEMLVTVIKKLSGLSLTDISNAAIAVIAVGVVIAGVLKVINGANDAYKGVVRLGVFAIALSASILVLSVAIDYLSKLSLSGIAKGTAAVVAVMGMFALILAATKNAQKVTATVIAMSITIGALMISIALLSGMDSARLLKSVSAISAVLLALSFVFAALKNIKMTSALGQAIGIGLVLAAIVSALVTIEGLKLESVLANAKALSLVVLSIGAILLAMSTLNSVSAVTSGKAKVWGSIKSTIAAIIPVIGIMVVAVVALAALKALNIDASVETVGSLILLISALAGAAMLMNLTSKNLDIKSAGGVFIELIGLGISAAGALWIIKDVDGATEKAAALSRLILTLGATASVTVLAASAFGGVGNQLGAIAVTALEIIALGVTASFALKELDGVDATIEKAGALSLVIVALGATAAIMSAFKVDPGAVLSGIAAVGELAFAIAVVVGIIASIAAAIGYLDQNGTLKTAIDNGMATLSAIVEGLGKMIGSFITGIGEGVTSGLPQMGDDIGAFGEGLKKFFDAFDGVDTAAAVGAVGAIVELLIGNTGNNILKRLNSIFGGENTSLEDLVGDLNAFGEGFVTFASTIDQISDTSVSKMETMVDLISALTEATPETGGILSFFKGHKKDLATFGEDLEAFGKAFIQFYIAISQDGITYDETIVDSVKNMGLTMAGLNESLPNTGGILQDWLGSPDLGNFGTSLAQFGLGFRTFYNIVKDMDVNTKLISTITNAADGFAKVNDKLPATGGVLQDWIGSPSLATWGADLVTFGTMFVNFYDTIKDLSIDDGKVKSVANAADCLAALNDHLPETGGVFEKWFGSNQTIGDFGSDLQKFGSGFRAFYTTIQSFAVGDDVSSAVDGMLELIDGVSQGLTELDKNDVWGYTKFNDFGEGLRSFGQGLNAFYSAITSFDSFDRLGINPIQKLQNGGESLIEALVTGIDNKVFDLKLAGSRAVIGFSEGIDSAVSESNFTAFIDEFLNYIGVTLGTEFGNSMKMKNHSWRAVLGFAEGIDAGIPEVEASMQNLTDTVLDKLYSNLGINSPSTKFLEAANYCIQGFVLGIKNNSDQAYSGVSTLTAGILNQFRKDFKINSPSVVMRDEVGRYLVDGIAEGIESNMSAIDAAKTMASNIVSAFRDEFDKFTLDMTTFDLEYQLWEAYNPDATSDQIAQKKLEMLANKMTAQAEKVNLAEAQYKATLQALGENSEETQTAYNTYLQESLSMAQFANQMQELQKQLYDSTGSTYTKQNAKAFIDEYKDTLLENGFTEEEIARYLAQHEADVDANVLVGTSVMDIVDKYMAQSSVALAEYGNGVEVILDTTLADVMANAATSAGTSSSTTSAFYSSGAAAGNAFTEGVEETTKSGLGGLFDSLMSGDKSLKDIAGEGMSAIGEYSSGNLVTGIINGISNAGETLSNAGKSVVDWFNGGVTEEAEINSPSKLMYRNGAYLIQGLANGIEDNTPLVTDAFDGTFLTITDTIDNMDRDALGTTLNDLIFNGSKAFSQTDTKWSRYGGSLVTSIKDGMVDNKNLLIDSGTTIAYAIIDTYLDAFEMDDIMSTSEVFYQIGASIAQSMNKGLLENLDPMLGGIGTALGHFSESSSTPSSYGYGNAEVKAVISPVIDSEALSKTGEEIKDFYDTVLRFDSNGNFVPYGYSGGSTGGFTKTSKTSTAVSRRNDEMLMRIYEAIVDDRDPKDPSNDKSSSEYNYTFNQYNTSPKALSESEIYRQTGNLFSRVKEVGQ